MVGDRFIVEELKKLVEKYVNYNGSEIAEAQSFINDLFRAFGFDRMSIGAKFEVHPNSLDASGRKRMDCLW